jgi:hypothetical protein
MVVCICDVIVEEGFSVLRINIEISEVLENFSGAR